MFFPAPTSPVGIFANENYLHEFQYQDFKNVVINFIKEFEELKRDIKK